MEFLKGIAFGAVLLVLFFGLQGKGIKFEIQRNDEYEPPSDRQIRWHIRQMREDLMLLVRINLVLLGIVLSLVFFKVLWP